MGYNNGSIKNGRDGKIHEAGTYPDGGGRTEGFKL